MPKTGRSGIIRRNSGVRAVMGAAVAALTLGLLPVTSQAQQQAQQPLDEVQVDLLAGTCTTCHGPDGRSPGAIPTIAGKSEQALLESLLAFKSGDLQGTIMNRHARGYTDEELAALARWFAAR